MPEGPPLQRAMASSDDERTDAGGSWPPIDAVSAMRARLGLAPLTDLLARIGGPPRHHTLSMLYIVGSLLGALALFQPAESFTDRRGFQALLISGWAIGALTLLLRTAMGHVFEHLAIAYANLAIFVGNLQVGMPGLPFLPLFFWPALYVGWFFSAREAVAHTLWAGLCVAATMALAPAQSVLALGVMLVTLSLVCVAISMAAGRTRRLVERIEVRTRIDALTQVANRHALDEALNAIARDAGTRVVAVLTVDVDAFKRVNDTLGHAAGDEVLRAVARSILSSVRLSDPVFRVGGDEFVAVLIGAELPVARRVAEAIGVATRDAEMPCPITLSVGVAVGCPAQIGELLRRADAAMYSVKSAGGGGVGDC